MELINADITFLVMLGSGIWSSLQLAQGAHQRRGHASRSLFGMTALEGLLCAMAWLATSAIAAGAVGTTLLLQSVLVGAIWAGFGYVARLPFGERSQATQ